MYGCLDFWIMSGWGLCFLVGLCLPFSLFGYYCSFGFAFCGGCYGWLWILGLVC